MQSVKVSWQTLSEVQFVGFNVLRTTDGNARESLNPETIIAEYAGADLVAPYVYIDTTVQPGMTYQYVLEAIRSDGSTERFNFAAVTASWSLSLPLIVDN